jgi:hypothetical protein
LQKPLSVPRIDAAPTTVHWGFFDANLSPVHTIDSGERITISSVSGGPELMPPPPFDVPPALPAIHAANGPQRFFGHMCTGPVAVRGARAGQTLQVDIEAIDLHYDWGYNVIRPLAGALPDDFPEYRPIHISLNRSRLTGRLPWGQEIPLRPFSALWQSRRRQIGAGSQHCRHAGTAETSTTKNLSLAPLYTFRFSLTARFSRWAMGMARRAMVKFASLPSRPGWLVHSV